MVVARDLRAVSGSAGVTAALAREPKGKQKKAPATTAGPGWFEMQGAPRTPDLEADLRVLAHRAALDPKHHYRRGVTAALAPKKNAPFPLVQRGTVVEDPTAYFSDRLPRRMRARTVLDTLMRDVERHQTLKRRYSALQEASRARIVRVKLGRRPAERSTVAR